MVSQYLEVGMDFATFQTKCAYSILCCAKENPTSENLWQPPSSVCNREWKAINSGKIVRPDSLILGDVNF